MGVLQSTGRVADGYGRERQTSPHTLPTTVGIDAPMGQKGVDMSKHITLARTVGPKAGFNAYMATKVHTAAERQAEIRSAGNKKAQFDAYCAIFGDQFGPVKGAGAARSNEQRTEVVENGTSLLQRLGIRKANDTVGVEAFEQDEVDPVVAALAAKLDIPVETLVELAGANVSATVAETKPTTTTTRTIPVAKRISWPMAMALKKIATKQGVAFSITSKTGGEGTGEQSNYGIKFAGHKLTPQQASEIIGASKA